MTTEQWRANVMADLIYDVAVAEKACGNADVRVV